MLLNDTVPNRFHWPCNADLRINNMQYRVYTRTHSQKLSANGRDEPARAGGCLVHHPCAGLVNAAVAPLPS